MKPAVQWVQVDSIGYRGQAVQIEYQWVGVAAAETEGFEPLIVFLHEGLGCVAMWKDFPEQLCRRLGARGLVYSRVGYGQSTPRAVDEHWGIDFLAQHAAKALPALLQALNITPSKQKIILFGHSDGGTIALHYAAMFPKNVAGIVVLAPHIMAEPISLRSIQAVRRAYEANSGLKTQLVKYHRDPDSAFYGWNNAWLNPAFASWNITDALQTLRCTTLAIQGVDDEYGTMAQIDGIAAINPNTTLLKLQHCGHSPHKDYAGAVMDAVAAWLNAQA